jgi:hypothetical protein
VAAIALLALLLVSGCGGGSDSTSTAQRKATTAPPAAAQAPAKQPSPSPSKGEGKDSNGHAAEREKAAKAPPLHDASSSFTPKPHHDSGGGAHQFATKGGDNSIQEAGSEAGESEFDQASVALHTYLDARAAGAWRDACSVLAPSVAESLSQLSAQARAGHKPLSCPPLIAALSAGVPPVALREAAQADVGALRVNGDGGFLLFHGPGGTEYFMPMAKEGETWKVAAIAASPLG